MTDGPAEPAPTRSAATEPTAEPAPPPTAELTPEQRAARIRSADRATRGVLAAVLGLEALVTLLVPRALAYSAGGLGVTKTILLVGLAVLLVLAAGLLRRPWAIGLGSALQVVFVLTGIWLLAMLVLGAIFAAIWLRVLLLRRDLVGTPGGWRTLYS